MKKDKNNLTVVKDSFLIVEDKVCQARFCDDGTMLYKVISISKYGEIELEDDYFFPDSYEPSEIEIISSEKAAEILIR